jgi:hypothetical protein
MKKALVYTAILALLTVWSCKDKFLEFNPPPNQFTDVTFFKTPEQFNSFVIGTYTELLRYTDWAQMMGYISQEARPKSTIPMDLPGYMVATQDRIKNYWQSMYVISSRTNILLAKLKEAPATVSAADRVKVEGEAQFLRGFAYFNIARSFGDAPLLLETYSISQTTVQCTPEDKIWDQVIVDLTAASQNLPTREQWGNTNYGRATKGAALAFLANAHMYKKNWAEAAKASEDLIAMNNYKLATTSRAAFTEALTPENIGESIFEVQYRDGGFEWSNQVQTGSLIGAFTAPDGISGNYAPFGGWGEMVLGQDIRNSMDPLDDRRSLIVREGETYKGERMSEPVILGTTFPITQKNVDFSTKYWLGKSGDVVGSNVPLMRYAEFLLNYAEILFEQGKFPQAYAQLNAVRTRAKLPDLAVSGDREMFMMALMNERRWELNTEPNLWFHYTRTGRLKDLKDAQGQPYDPTYNKFPIPQSERDQNPNLCQNKGY